MLRCPSRPQGSPVGALEEPPLYRVEILQVPATILTFLRNASVILWTCLLGAGLLCSPLQKYVPGAQEPAPTQDGGLGFTLSHDFSPNPASGPPQLLISLMPKCGFFKFLIKKFFG